MSFVQTFFLSLSHFSLFPLGILLGLGIISGSPVQATEENFSISQGTSSREISLTQASATLADGVYLYGRSPQPETLGQEYLVFQVRDAQVMGAFYMPRSEFSCFSGSLNSRQMNLLIVDPYDGTKHNYVIALEAASPVAFRNNRSSEIGLKGYYRLNTISENDQRILKTCLSAR